VALSFWHHCTSILAGEVRGRFRTRDTLNVLHERQFTRASCPLECASAADGLFIFPAVYPGTAPRASGRRISNANRTVGHDADRESTFRPGQGCLAEPLSRAEEQCPFLCCLGPLRSPGRQWLQSTVPTIRLWRTEPSWFAGSVSEPWSIHEYSSWLYREVGDVRLRRLINNPLRITDGYWNCTSFVSRVPPVTVSAHHQFDT
jgi:hypothetical protein